MINVTETFLPPLEEYTAILERIWRSKWLTNRGELVLELEERLKDYLGVSDLLAVNNGTIALQIAIKALGLTGDIITTPFSYVATASCIVWEGCNPVFVDIDTKHLTIDETKIKEAITPQTSAILATHVYGNPCNVEEIEKIAKKHALKVIYDAAHCFGVKYKGESILKWGDVSTLSFHATKLFHTGEGGAILSNDPILSDKIFYHHNFGHRGEDAFCGLGVNGKMSELNAAMGLAVLPYIDDIVAKRKAVCDAYDRAFSKCSLQKVQIREETEWNYSYYPVIFPNETQLLSAKRAFNEARINPRRYFFPTLNNLPYVENCQVSVADDISRRVLCLPLAASLSKAETEQVCDLLKRVTEC